MRRIVKRILTRSKNHDNIQNIAENNELVNCKAAICFAGGGWLYVMKGIFLLACFLCSLFVTGCGDTASLKLKIAVVQDSQSGLIDMMKKTAAEEGLMLDIVQCKDYAEPNVMLANGEVDAVTFQTEKYLQEQIAERGFDFVVLTRTVLFPIGIYSARGRTLAEPMNASVAIPDDAAGGSRALQLLEQAGLLKLQRGIKERVSLQDIAENFYGLQIFAVDALSLPQLLPTIDFVVMGTSLADEAGLVPRRDALCLESADSVYANALVVRREDVESPAMQKLKQVYSMPEIREFIETGMDGRALPAQ